MRGIRARLPEVKEIFENERLDVFVLVETFLRREQSVQVSARSISIMNEARQGKRAAGSVTVLLKDGFQCKVLKKEAFFKTKAVVVHVGCSVLGAIYCPPRASWKGL